MQLCSTCCTAAFAQHGTAAIVCGMDGVAVPLGAALLKSKLGWESEEEAAMAVAAEAHLANACKRPKHREGSGPFDNLQSWTIKR